MAVNAITDSTFSDSVKEGTVLVDLWAHGADLVK